MGNENGTNVGMFTCNPFRDCRRCPKRGGWSHRTNGTRRIDWVRAKGPAARRTCRSKKKSPCRVFSVGISKSLERLEWASFSTF